MSELKKIGVLSLAKIAGLFGVIYGLLSGILVAVAYSKVSEMPELAAQLGIVSQWGYYSIIIFPILNAVIYFIVGILLALIYNLLAKYIGGVQLEFKK